MEYDIIIIGAGPAGYVAAIRAGQVGLKTAIIEKENVGGMCLNWGCIPTKSIIESAKVFDKIKRSSEFGIDGIDTNKLSFNWKKAKTRSTTISKKLTAGIKYLLKKNGVEVIAGTARILDNGSIKVGDNTFTAKNIIIATGSYPAPVSENLKNADVLQLDKLIELDEIPENIVIAGKGIHAVELAQFFRLIGKTVTIISEDENFMPKIDDYLKSFIFKKLKDDGIRLITGKLIDKFEKGNIFIDDEKITCDKIINCSFRKAVTPLSESKIDLTASGFIKINEYFETSAKNIYAIGDVTGKSFLAHMASAQGIFVVNKIKGIKKEFSFSNYPMNFYTSPEIAQLGLTEQELKAEKVDYKVSEFPLSANGKALIEGNTEGFVRILSDKIYGQVLGVQIVAVHATDMISEASALMQIEGTVYDVANTIHAHPTISEIFMEAGFEAVDKAIHK